MERKCHLCWLWETNGCAYSVSKKIFKPFTTLCQSFFLSENELNSTVVEISGWLVLVHVDAACHGTDIRFRIHSTRLFYCAAILILLSYTSTLAWENLRLKLERLGSKIILMGLIFPMEKKLLESFALINQSSRQDEGQDAFHFSHSGLWVFKMT